MTAYELRKTKAAARSVCQAIIGNKHARVMRWDLLTPDFEVWWFPSLGSASLCLDGKIYCAKITDSYGPVFLGNWMFERHAP